MWLSAARLANASVAWGFRLAAWQNPSKSGCQQPCQGSSQLHRQTNRSLATFTPWVLAFFARAGARPISPQTIQCQARKRRTNRQSNYVQHLLKILRLKTYGTIKNEVQCSANVPKFNSVCLRVQFKLYNVLQQLINLLLCLFLGGVKAEMLPSVWHCLYLRRMSDFHLYAVDFHGFLSRTLVQSARCVVCDHLGNAQQGHNDNSNQCRHPDHLSTTFKHFVVPLRAQHMHSMQVAGSFTHTRGLIKISCSQGCSFLERHSKSSLWTRVQVHRSSIDKIINFMRYSQS